MFKRLERHDDAKGWRLTEPKISLKLRTWLRKKLAILFIAKNYCEERLINCSRHIYIPLELMDLLNLNKVFSSMNQKKQDYALQG